MLIRIPWRCQCLKQEAVLMVSARGSNEDISVFMKRVQHQLGIAHRAVSPSCGAKTVEYVKIPVNDDVIGGVA